VASQERFGQAIDAIEGETMDFSQWLDVLRQRVAAARTAVQTATTESRELIGTRIDQGEPDLFAEQLRAAFRPLR